MNSTSTLCVVQARTGSTRLPGKVLADVAGRPMLRLMLDRLTPLRSTGLTVIVATSELGQDDPVAELATEADVPVVRGDEADVLGRFLLALDRYPTDTVVRLTADCPLLDPALVLLALDAHQAAGAGYTSNTLVRTFPDGMDVEVIAASVLRAADREATSSGEREHVTPFAYVHTSQFGLAQFTGLERLGRE